MHHKEKFIEWLLEINLSAHRKEINCKSAELQRLLARNEELNAVFRQLYEDNFLGKVSTEQYKLLSESYTNELNEVRKRIAAHKDKKEIFTKDSVT